MNGPLEAYRGSEPYLFVTYAHADKDLVHAEIGRLRSLGYRIWFDEGIQPSAIWTDEIQRALENAIVVLVFLSASALESRWVRREIHVAIEQLGKQALIVYLEKTELKGGLILLLGEIQAVHRYLYPEDEYQRRLLKALPAIAREGQALDASALERRGLEHAARGEHPQAIACFTKALAMAPDQPSLYEVRALSHLRIGSLDECHGDFEKAHALDPTREIPKAVRGVRFRTLRLIKRHLPRWGHRWLSPGR